MTNIYTEAKEIAAEAIKEIMNQQGHMLCTDDLYEAAREYVWQTCDSHEVSIYYHAGIKFCADQNTEDGEIWLEDCGGISQDGDSFGQIACRIAFATLLVRSEEALHELVYAA